MSKHIHIHVGSKTKDTLSPEEVKEFNSLNRELGGNYAKENATALVKQAVMNPGKVSEAKLKSAKRYLALRKKL